MSLSSSTAASLTDLDPLTPDNNTETSTNNSNDPQLNSSSILPKTTRSASGSSSRSLFHTPPPVDPARQSWLSDSAEKESYGGTGTSSVDPTSSQKLDITPTTTPSSHPSEKDQLEAGKDSVPNDDKKDGLNLSSSSSLSKLQPDSTVTATSLSSSLSENPTTEDSEPEQESTNKSNIAAAKAASNLPPVLSHSIDRFVARLKAPRFRSPLMPSAVSLLYQSFYDEFSTKADEYLTQSTLSFGSVTAAAGPATDNTTSNTTTGSGVSTSGSANNNNTPGAGNSLIDTPMPTSLPALHFRKREIKMETYEEIAEKRRERAMRPIRIKEYTETAEARSTTLIYERLFRPAVGTDISRNEIINLRIKALREIPLTPKLLDFDLEVVDDILPDNDQDENLEVNNEATNKLTISQFINLLKPVGDKFAEMDVEQTPLGKLNVFLEGHRMIVEDVINSLYLSPETIKPTEPSQTSTEKPISNTPLKSTKSATESTPLRRHSSISSNTLYRSKSSSTTHPQHQQEPKKSISKSAAADHILPLLIYTFVHFDIPDLWLQLGYIMRYRNANATSSGEVAYPLTNWQAALGFIETSTFSSLGIEDKYPEIVMKKKPSNNDVGEAKKDKENQEQTKEEKQEQEPSNEEEEKKQVVDKENVEIISDKDSLLEQLLEVSPYTTEYDVFTDPPSSIPLSSQGSIRAHLRHHRLSQIIAHTSGANHNTANNNGNNSNNGSASSDPHNNIGLFNTINSTSLDGRRSSAALSPNELVLSADQSIKSLGTTFGNSYRFLMSKINSRDNEYSSASDHPQQENIISPAFNNALLSRPRNPSLSAQQTHVNGSNQSSNNNSSSLQVAEGSTLPEGGGSSSSAAHPLANSSSPLTSPPLVARRLSSSSIASSSASIHSNSSSAVGPIDPSDTHPNHSTPPSQLQQQQQQHHNEPFLGRLVRSLRSNNDFKASTSASISTSSSSSSMNNPDSSNTGNKSTVTSSNNSNSINLTSGAVTGLTKTSSNDSSNTGLLTSYLPPSFLAGGSNNNNNTTNSSSSSSQSPSSSLSAASSTSSSGAGTGTGAGAGAGTTDKTAPPIESLLSKDWTSLTVKDIQALHKDYIRMANYLKSINAFQ